MAMRSISYTPFETSPVDVHCAARQSGHCAATVGRTAALAFATAAALFGQTAVAQALPAQAAPAGTETFGVVLGATGFVENPCAPPPEVFVKYWGFSGEPPAPTVGDMQVYKRYLDYLQANDWAFRCLYRQENMQAAGSRPRVVFMGDSITQHWRQRDAELFGPGFLDRGISGQTTPQMVVRFYQDVIDLKPRTVQIMAGTNDVAANTGPMADDQFQADIKIMVELAQAHGIKVILASIPPAKAFYWRPQLRPAQKIRELNAWLRGYADTRGLVFVDYYGVLAGADGGYKEGLSGDGVHPSHAGYVLMDALFQKALAQAERP
jgi:lysophospholipase L1-like esterase